MEKADRPYTTKIHQVCREPAAGKASRQKSFPEKVKVTGPYSSGHP